MRLMHRLVTMTSCWLVGYLVFWLIGWLPRFPVGTLVGYLNFRFVGWLAALLNLLVGSLDVWLIGWLSDFSLIGYLDFRLVS